MPRSSGLQKRKASSRSVQEELETTWFKWSSSSATPDREGVQRLEGNVLEHAHPEESRFGPHYGSGARFRLAFKQVTLTMPAYVWEALASASA